ncbi:MAG: hypothetical protein AAFZ80_04440 [Cyanobacteria bacterium P01_A01_bin.105]
MQDKQKVTLYLSDDLHRQLKIRSAVDREPMSALAQKALDFYLAHSEVVESFRDYGQTHRVYTCPECSTALTLASEGLSSVKSHASSSVAPAGEGIDSEMSDRLNGRGAETVVPDTVPASVPSDDASSGKGELVPC